MSLTWGRPPKVTLCGREYHVKPGTFREIPKLKAVTEKRSLTNARRRQISWEPKSWEFVITACSRADYAALRSCYQSETYAVYAFSFSYTFYYPSTVTGSATVTIDMFTPTLVIDNPERWDVAMKVTEWTI